MGECCARKFLFLMKKKRRSEKRRRKSYLFHGSELILAVSEETKFGFEAVETLMM